MKTRNRKECCSTENIDKNHNKRSKIDKGTSSYFQLSNIKSNVESKESDIDKIVHICGGDSIDNDKN